MLREAIPLQIDPGQTNLLALLNPQLLNGTGALTFRLANTRLVALSEAIRQLLHYPYGCVEQTSSSLLPWLLLESTPELLPLTGQDAGQARAAAAAGIRRLFSMQTEPGGLSYWPGGKEPLFWGSAYAGLALVTARQAGLAVPAKDFDALLAYLATRVRPSEETEEPNARCLALYVLALAGKPQPALHTRLLDNPKLLDAEDRALLAMAITVGEASTNSVRELLTVDPLEQSGAGAFGCPARSKAVRLLAAITCGVNPHSAETLFSDLMAEQKHGHWTTTQGNAWSLLALHEFIRQTETGAQPAAGAITWGAETAEFKIDPTRRLFSRSIPLAPARADLPVLLTNASSKPIFAQLAVESRVSAPITAPQNHGFNLTRRYERLDDDNQPQPFESLRVGDRVLVTLDLTVPEPSEYVALDDALPGLLEAVNPEFKTQQAAGPAAREIARWPGDFQEIRADRVLFFSDLLPAGEYRIRYVARVRAAGAFTAPPAKAEAMYQPDRFGLTECQTLTSRPDE